jgi:hypothetical protein
MEPTPDRIRGDPEASGSLRHRHTTRCGKRAITGRCPGGVRAVLFSHGVGIIAAAGVECNNTENGQRSSVR